MCGPSRTKEHGKTKRKEILRLAGPIAMLPALGDRDFLQQDGYVRPRDCSMCSRLAIPRRSGAMSSAEEG